MELYLLNYFLIWSLISSATLKAIYSIVAWGEFYIDLIKRMSI